MTTSLESGRQAGLATGRIAGLEPAALSVEPLMAALAAFRGKFIDAEEAIEIDGRMLEQAVERLVKMLADHDLAQGDRVVLAVGNGPRFVTALAALMACGASPILLHVQTPVAELVRTARRYGASFLISDEWGSDDWPAAGIAERPIVLDGWAHFRWGHILGDADGDSSFPALAGVPLHPTSGTTGQSKLAVRPAASAIAEAAHYAQTIDACPRDVILVTTPMSHAYAFGMGVMVPLITSATAVSLRRFSAATAMAAIARYGVSILPAVPAMLDVLLFGAGARALTAPRMVLSAGAPLSRRTVKRFQSTTGRPLCPLYGTTETGGITVATAGVGVEESLCVGPPMNGVEARLGPAEGELPSADAGHVEIRSSSMMLGYLSAREIDATALEGGWFQTGDLGRMDADGRIHLLGRETEIINVAGMKVVPSEIEDVLGQLPEVIECKVYAGRHRDGNQFVQAAIVAEPSVDLTRLRSHCASHLVYYKRPERFYRLNALPRSPAGKILKDQLP